MLEIIYYYYFCMVLVSARFQLERVQVTRSRLYTLLKGLSSFPSVVLAAQPCWQCNKFSLKTNLHNYNVQLVLTQVVLNWLQNSIRHLHISHNALFCPPSPPLKILHKHCLQFLLERCNTQEKWKTKAMQTFEAQMSYIMGDVTVAYICSVVLWRFE